MSSVDEKLRRGFGLIERAESDSDLLGVALLAINSALEDFLRGALSNHPVVDDLTRQRLIRRELSWTQLADLTQQHLGLNDEQRKLVLEAQEIRRSFIHGNHFRWRLGDVLRYGRLAELICGHEGLLDETLLARRAERRSRPLPAADPVLASQPETTQATWAITRIAIMVGVLGAIVISLLIGYQWLDRTVLRELAPPQQTPTAGLVVSPAAAPTVVRTGRIVNLGGSPGWLHEEPNFSSATRPNRLAEGDTVVLLNVAPVEGDGTTWQKVEAGGYQGWSPVNNIAIDQ